MWCTLDAGDIPDDSPNLYYDQQNWLHRNALSWHTLSGEFAHDFSWSPVSSGHFQPHTPVSPLLPMNPPPGRPGADDA